MNIQNTEFVKSAASKDGFIRDGLAQVVFAGRSNVGKSSVLNCLTRRGNFARVSGTPGKTAHVNYFKVDGRFYIADLPGYGYAKVSGSEKARWAALMEEYFSSKLISAGVLIVDSRHKPTADDLTMVRWFKESNVPVTVVANKLDKLKKSEIEPNIERIKLTLELSNVIAFSAETRFGREELVGCLARFS
jgi:GTP-binding protein